MGTGTFRSGKFDLVVVANGTLSASHKAQWQSRFIEASQALFDATQGRLQLGNIYMSDNGWGRAAAEAILHAEDGRSYATLAGFGRMGQAMHLFDSVRTGDPRTIVHELGHHLFGLLDEYTMEVITDAIDTNTTPAEWATNGYDRMPLTGSEHPPATSATLVYADAILQFDDVLETRIVNQHTPTLVTIFNVFNSNPHGAKPPVILYQRTQGVGCSESATADFCLMESYASVPNRTEFCSPSNHDPDGDTAHTARYGGKSCQEVIAETMSERWDYDMEAPNPQTAEFPIFYDLVKQNRIMLVLDRSGSMNEAGKIDGVKWGVDYWLNYQVLADDVLGIVWFNQDQDVSPLTPADALDIVSAVQNANAIEAGGSTNIRDALAAARDEISSQEGKAVEAVVLLTDGIHNTPYGSSSLEVIPSFKDLGIPIFALPIGGADVTEYEPLEELAEETGGIVFPIPQSLENSEIDIPLQGLIGIYLGILGTLIHTGLLLLWIGEIGSSPRPVLWRKS